MILVDKFAESMDFLYKTKIIYGKYHNYATRKQNNTYFHKIINFDDGNNACFLKLIISSSFLNIFILEY